MTTVPQPTTAPVFARLLRRIARRPNPRMLLIGVSLDMLVAVTTFLVTGHISL